MTVGEDGATHQCNEDIALMRVLPGMVVLQPCDANETKAMMQFMVDYDGPVYLRTSRYAVDNILDSNYKFLLGEIVPIVKGCKIAFLATGIMVNEARKAIEILAKNNIYPSLYNVSSLKPINTMQLNSIINSYDLIFTLEEHNIIGGLYSLVCEKLDKPKKIYPIAIQDIFGESGTPEELMSKYKIDADYLVKSVLETVEE